MHGESGSSCAVPAGARTSPCRTQQAAKCQPAGCLPFVTVVWVPAHLPFPPLLQLVNFAFVPKHLRIPYVAAVSFGWTVILSVMQGKFDAAIAQRSAAAAAAGEPAVLSAVQSAQAAAAAAAAPGSAAPAAPSQPSLLPLAAAAVVKHERAATAATHAPLVAAAATAAGLPPRGAGAAVEEA